MKKQIKQIILIAISLPILVLSQGGTPGNIRTPINFLGYQAFPGPAGPLQIRNDHNNHIAFFTAGPNNTRMRIFGNGLSSSCPLGGGVGINPNPANPIVAPGSFLHIGTSVPTLNNASVGIFGWRNWMQLGTFMYDATDNMYVGLKNEAAPFAGDRYDAVINWGDNISNLNISPIPGPDYLRFIFTGSYNPGGNNSLQNGAAGNVNGLEVMRVAPIGHLGIGNFFNNPLYPFRDPFRRLEILSDKTLANANGNPQFRITHTQQNPNNLNTGRFTDMLGTNLGDLAISPLDNTLVNTATRFFRQRYVGIHTNLPGNTLEINSQFANAATPNAQPATAAGAPTGWAGLRFSDLNATSIPQANPGVGVLAVDSLGDVIYVPADTTANFGNLCTVTAQPKPLTGDFRIPTNLFHYKFYGQGVIDNITKEDIVSVGYDCGQIAPYRFSVLESQSVQPVPDPTYAGHFKNDNVSLLTSAFNLTGGVFGEARGLLPSQIPNSPVNVGGVFEGFGSWSNIGVFGRMNPLALPSNFGPSRYNIGVAGISDLAVNNAGLPPANNYGVYAIGFNAPAGVDNFGVYGEVNSTGLLNAAIFGKAPQIGGNDFAGYFDGDVTVLGNFTNPSDQTLKQNIDSIPNALNILNQLSPKKFQFKTTQYPQMSLPAGDQYGMIAQDVQNVLPNIVSSANYPERTIGSTTYPAFTYSTVEYTQLIPFLVRAVQQLSAQNHKLDSLITALTQTVSSCCSNSAAKQTGINGNDPNALSQINVNLSDIDMIVLDQNKPNPFAEQTTITYNVPEKYGFAQLVFKTIDGKIIKTVDITKKGRGQVNVFANDLSNGLYMYSLIVDGKTIDTKKMVKQN